MYPNVARKKKWVEAVLWKSRSIFTLCLEMHQHIFGHFEIISIGMSFLNSSLVNSCMFKIMHILFSNKLVNLVNKLSDFYAEICLFTHF